MDKEQINHLGAEIQHLLEIFEVDYEQFVLKVFVSPQDFEDIEAHFPDRPNELSIIERGDRWTVSLHKAGQIGISPDELRNLQDKARKAQE
ncbi:MAG: hypothetical protein SF029_11095 [bacterium]|nr:hypothetical protein [bacterium]